jgi:hypothetical protein
MATKRITPYARLLETARRFAFSVKYANTKSMFFYPTARLSEGWALREIHSRTMAADQIGYDVIVQAKDDGLHIKYRKRVVAPYPIA